jgi:hypothetical protein
MGESPPTTFAAAAGAMRRLHEALPAWVSFALYRRDATHVPCDHGTGLRDPGQPRPDETTWSVVVQQIAPVSSHELYLHASLGTDLASVTEEAIEHFFAWGHTGGTAPTSGDATKPPKLTAPGSADLIRGQRRKDAS